MQEFSPCCFEVPAGNKARERLANDAVSIHRLQTRDPRQNLQFGNAAEQWRDERLNRYERPIARKRIRPAFKKMCRWKMPVALGKSFIFVITQPRHHLGLALCFGPI